MEVIEVMEERSLTTFPSIAQSLPSLNPPQEIEAIEVIEEHSLATLSSIS